MGDMADDFLDFVLDEEDDRNAYWHGEMTTEEAIDRGILNEQGGEDS